MFVSNMLSMVVCGNNFLLLPSNVPQASLNLICLTILVTLRALPQFKLIIEHLVCRKVLKFVLLYNNISYFFFEALMWYLKPFKFGLGPFLAR